jgi:hypothetical protein
VFDRGADFEAAKAHRGTKNIAAVGLIRLVGKLCAARTPERIAR